MNICETVSSVEEFYRFIDKYAYNAACIYHVGYGTTDTTISTLIKIAAWRAAIKGDVYLVQRRKYGTNLFEFIAIRASKPPIRKLMPTDLSWDSGRERKTNIYMYSPGSTGAVTRKQAKRLLERVQDERIG